MLGHEPLSVANFRSCLARILLVALIPPCTLLFFCDIIHSIYSFAPHGVSRIAGLFLSIS
jgi:hypothetical protein